MAECWDVISAYGLRSIGIGERLLPRTDITLCQQMVLIGSGLLWNIYFAVIALISGFWLAIFVAVGKASKAFYFQKPASFFIFLFRGSPLFIQFFFAYELLVLLPRSGIDVFGTTVETGWLSRAWAGALIVLFLNTSAYSAQIFYGAIQSLPKTELEAAEAFGMKGWSKFRRIALPSMLRLAWPAYTNEAIFLFHATTLVFFTGFPAWQQRGDALYYAKYFADKTFNPFVAYPIVAFYFVVATLVIIWLFGLINRKLNRHLPNNARRIRYRPQILR